MEKRSQLKKETRMKQVSFFLQHPGFFEAEPLPISNNQMIEEIDLQDACCLVHASGNSMICFARGWIA